MSSCNIDQPGELSTDPHFFDLLTGSFRQLLGRPLVSPEHNAQWLFRDAPFVVLAHDGGEDPRFTYANRTALTCFGYTWQELIGLPSRFSAEAPERAERQRLLEAVQRDGFISDYRGVRITKSGHRFMIEQAIVWQLIDLDGKVRGQAATFSDWQAL
jgi:PAS domain S-box-containing protein